MLRCARRQNCPNGTSDTDGKLERREALLLEDTVGKESLRTSAGRGEERERGMISERGLVGREEAPIRVHRLEKIGEEGGKQWTILIKSWRGWLNVEQEEKTVMGWISIWTWTWTWIGQRGERGGLGDQSEEAKMIWTRVSY